MSERMVHDPQNPGAELPVGGAVDTLGGTGTTPGSRPGSVHLFPHLVSGVELATGFFNRLRTRYIGTVDGFRVGELVAGLSESVTNILSNLWSEAAEGNANLDLLTSHLSSLNTKATRNATQILSDPMMRKLAGIDAGAVTVTATGYTVDFTGVELEGRCVVAIEARTGRRIIITDVVDPAGGGVGTLTLAERVTTGTVLVIPYLTTPHAWNSAADATQTLAVVGDPPRINGPAQFISVAGAAVVNGTYQYILPCALYGRQQLQIRWAVNGNTLFQFRSYAKIDNTIAWPAAGFMVAGQCVDAQWQYGTGSLAFGSAPVGGAATNVINAWPLDPRGFDSVAIEMIISNQSGTSTVSAFVRLTGGTA